MKRPLTLATLAILTLPWACNPSGPQSPSPEQEVLNIEAVGTIDTTDPVDGEYGGYHYDQYVIELSGPEAIVVETTGDGFEPIVGLFESRDEDSEVISRGAHLAEGTASEGTVRLEHRIPIAGTYLIRVFSEEESGGEYDLSIRGEGR